MIAGNLARFANRLLWRIDLQIKRPQDSNMLKSIFYRHYHDNFFFVQIGANNGQRFDPIYELVTRHKLAGLAIEPLPDLFEELKKLIADTQE
jgi:hypothetical protein